MTKLCPVCNVEKLFQEFNKLYKAKDGLQPKCRQCEKDYKINNKEKVRERNIRYREKYKEQIDEKGRIYRIKNRDLINERQKKYRQKEESKEKARIRRRARRSNPEYRKKEYEKERAWRQTPTGKLKTKQARDRYNAKPENKIKHAKRIREYRKNNPSARIAHNLRVRIRETLKRSGTRKNNVTMKLTGCSRAELIIHLESLWVEGMSWENYGHGEGKWSIDHTLPCDSFDLTIEDNQLKCFHYSNLKPMWFIENCIKNNKIYL